MKGLVAICTFVLGLLLFGPGIFGAFAIILGLSFGITAIGPAILLTILFILVIAAWPSK